ATSRLSPDRRGAQASHDLRFHARRLRAAGLPGRSRIARQLRRTGDRRLAGREAACRGHLTATGPRFRPAEERTALVSRNGADAWRDVINSVPRLVETRSGALR